MARSDRNRAVSVLGSMGAVVLALGFVSAPADSASPVKLAVFDFELEEASAVGSFPEQTADKATTAAALEKASSEARHELAQSGRYTLVDVSRVDAQPVRAKLLRNCNGCEAGIARDLGAEQSLLGVVMKASQTYYYVVIQIRDARTGKLLDQQGANFAGTEAGWASGVRMLIKHQVLAGQD